MMLIGAQLWASTMSTALYGQDHQEVADNTMSVCASASKFDVSIAADLAKAGWEKVDEGDRVEFTRNFVDGVIISSSVPQQNLDWAGAVKEANDMAAGLLGAQSVDSPSRIYIHHSVQTSALAIVARVEGQFDVLRCYYSGVGSPEIDSTVEVIARMDERNGIRQVNSEFRIVTITQFSPSEMPQHVSTQIAKYLATPDVFNDKPNVEIGFSVISATQI